MNETESVRERSLTDSGEMVDGAVSIGLPVVVREFVSSGNRCGLKVEFTCQGRIREC